MSKKKTSTDVNVTAVEVFQAATGETPKGDSSNGKQSRVLPLSPEVHPWQCLVDREAYTCLSLK